MKNVSRYIYIFYISNYLYLEYIRRYVSDAYDVPKLIL